MQHRYHAALTSFGVGLCLLTGCAGGPAVGRGKSGAQAPATSPTNAVAAGGLNTAEQATVTAHAHYAQGTILDLAGDPEAALQEFSLAAQADPANEQLVMDLARRYLQRSRPEQALEILLRATARPKASGMVFSRLAQVYAVQGKDDLARAASQTAIKRDPASLAGYLGLFLLEMKGAKHQAALAVLDQAAHQPNASVEFLVGLGELYANLQHQAPSLKEAAKPGAALVLKRAAELNPAAPLLRLKLAEDFYVLGDTQGATRIYLDLLERFPDEAELAEEVHTKLAQIYLQASDRQKAAEQLQDLLKGNPTYVQAYYVLGQLSLEAKKYADAADYFAKGLLLNDKFKDSEATYYMLAELQIILDRVPQAFTTLERAQAKYRDSFTIEFLKARAFSKQKDFTNALVHFTTAEVMAKAMEPARLNALFYFQLGAAHERKGDLAEAETAFKKTLEIDPDFSEALNYYGYMLADRGERLDAARAMVQKALDAEPKNAAFIDSMAWVFFRLHQPEKALPLALQAITLNEEPDATLYEHLGDIYAALQQPEQAREAYQKSVALEKNPAVQKKLEPAPGR